MIKETLYIKSLLPDHYSCEALSNGVYCNSSIGIDEYMEKDKWNEFMNKLEDRYGERFTELYYHTNYNHKTFIVYLKKV